MENNTKNWILECKKLVQSKKDCKFDEGDIEAQGTGIYVIGNYTIYYSEDQGIQIKNGIAIFISNEIVKTVNGFLPVSDRIMLIK